MRTNWMTPSGMSNVLGAVDPVPLVDRNFGLINARFGLAIAPTATADADSVADVLQTAFNAVAGALSITLWPVASSRDPEASVQANYEKINAAW